MPVESPVTTSYPVTWSLLFNFEYPYYEGALADIRRPNPGMVTEAETDELVQAVLDALAPVVAAYPGKLSLSASKIVNSEERSAISITP